MRSINNLDNFCALIAKFFLLAPFHVSKYRMYIFWYDDILTFIKRFGRYDQNYLMLKTVLILLATFDFGQNKIYARKCLPLNISLF
jgi:hypothetical protein